MPPRHWKHGNGHALIFTGMFKQIVTLKKEGHKKQTENERSARGKRQPERLYPTDLENKKRRVRMCGINKNRRKRLHSEDLETDKKKY